jgi:predicted aminopeptidase
MISTFGNRLCRVAVVVGFVASLSGCYYMQAARGQLEVMNKREPIDELIHASDTPADIVTRLELVQEARQFSIDELYLPDNDSYTSYADIERDYVVWNVFAAPEFSLEPKQWCFPVAGCVNYRGYFSKDAAHREAERLGNDSYDISVGGIAAYSTLGKFSDPVLNTMMHWEDTDLVALIFHELAHQLLYVKGDSGFNESFATAVEEIGIDRWLSTRGQENELAAYRQRRQLRERLMRHVGQARIDLELVYSADLGDAEKRARKRERLERLNAELVGEFDNSERAAPDWVNAGLNNARLASMNLYQGRLAEFRVLFDECDDDLKCFYSRSESLAAGN